MNLEHFRQTLELNKTKKTLRERTQAKLILPWAGGLFKVTSELLSFVDVMKRNDVKQTVISDSQENPILIEDVSAFHKALIETYQVEMNYWYEQYRLLRTIRKPTDV